ncbi:MAG TPA: hypothetical protein P5287_00885 [bacterium]|nr:hypothetical protein [bacterium]
MKSICRYQRVLIALMAFVFLLDGSLPVKLLADQAELLAPSSFTRQISPDEYGTYHELVKTDRDRKGADNATTLLMNDLLGLRGEAIPIRRRDYDRFQDGFVPAVPKTAVSGMIDDHGRVMIETEADKPFWQDKKKAFREKLLRVLRRNAVASYRGILKEVKFRIVENNYNLVSTERTPEGVYEIVIDRVLFELDDVNVYPLVKLALNHEFNHSLLHQEITGRVPDPLAAEIAVLLSDLTMFSGLGDRYQRDVRRALAALEAKGYVTAPYAAFLEAAGRNMKVRVEYAYDLTTDAAVSPALRRRVSELQKHYRGQNGSRRYIDYRRDIDGFAYSSLRPMPTTLKGYFAALEKMFAEPISIVREVTLPRLFADFDVRKLKTGDAVDLKREKKIIEETIPKLEAIGGELVRQEFERVLTVADYTMDIKTAVAQALLRLPGYKSLQMIRNPFFGREIINHLKQVKAIGGLTFMPDRRFRDISFKIMLLGKMRVSSAAQYRDIRAEIAWWTLLARNRAAEIEEMALKKQVMVADYRNFKRLHEICIASMESLKERLRDYLGPGTQEEGEWLAKCSLPEYPTVLPPTARGEERDAADAFDRTRQAVAGALKDSFFIRESLFVIEGIVLQDEAITKVEVSYFAKGESKINYRIAVTTDDGDTYVILANCINPNTFTGFPSFDAKRLRMVENEKLHLMSIGQPTVEIIGGDWNVDGIHLWTEEFLDGKTLDDYVEEKSSLPEEEFRATWQMLVRKHARIEFELYEKSQRTLANYDAHGGNSNWVEDEWGMVSGRINDIGELTTAPDPSKLVLSLFKLSLKIEADYYKRLKGSTRVADVCDGVLDALGETEGIKVLQAVVAGGEPMTAYLPVHIKKMDVREEIARYLAERVRDYVPGEWLEPLSGDELRIIRDKPNVSSYLIFVKRRLDRLRQSPWLWTYVNMRDIGKKQPDTPLAAAAEDLYRAVRADRSLLRPGAVRKLHKAMREIADRHSLGEKDRARLRLAGSYGGAIGELCGRMIAADLANKGGAAGEFPEGMAMLRNVFAKLATDPASASIVFCDMLNRSRDPRDDRMKQVRGIFMKLAGQTDEALFDLTLMILPTVEFFMGDGFISEDNVMTFLRKMPEDELVKVAKYGFIDILQELIFRDYKRFAAILNRMQHPEMKRLVPQVSYYLVSGEGVTLEETGYIFKELDLRVIREIVLMLAATELNLSRWGQRWMAIRAEDPDVYKTAYFPQAVFFIDELAVIDFNKAVDVTCALLRALPADYDIGGSFIGEREIVTGDGRRMDDLVALLSRVSGEILLNAFRRLHEQGDDGRIILFLSMIESCGLKKKAGRMLDIMAMEEALIPVGERFIEEFSIREMTRPRTKPRRAPERDELRPIDEAS